MNINNFKSVRSYIINSFPHVKCIILQKDAEIVFKYLRKDEQKDTLFPLASATKSVVSLLVGIAIKKGNISSVESGLLELVKKYDGIHIDERYSQIKIKHLLTMSSGLKWPLPSEENNLDFNSLNVINELDIEDETGTVFKYKPDVHLVCLLLDIISNNGLNSFLEENLLNPLCVERYSWNFIKDESISLRGADLLKIGQMCIDNGNWKEKGIVCPEYLKAATSVQITGGFPERTDYGYYWWVDNQHESYYAGGFGGQYLLIIPKQKIVAGIFSDMDKPYLENKNLLYELIDSSCT